MRDKRVTKAKRGLSGRMDLIGTIGQLSVNKR
jgi:hypothetical protein